MKNLILGTAGHIDHGKTTLVKVLTGIDCDTHMEEKTRGITINLGFAHLNLPDGNQIGIVDVPGHEDFIGTMVAGSSGIDFVMLVVAADEGVMPQTREHLQVLDGLGVKKGFIVISKTDLVDNEIINLARSEVLKLVKDTFLEKCDILEISCRNHSGINELKNYIADLAKSIRGKSETAYFRMYIDRIFTVKGFGTVVTGSTLGGILKKENKVYLMPDAKELRVRRIEKFGKEIKEVTAGSRASINLVGLNRADYKKGMMLSERVIPATNKIDVSLYLFKNSKPLPLWSSAIFLAGTQNERVKIHLISGDELKPGTIITAQIFFENNVTLLRGDRFVIRNTSSDTTLGGGRVLDAYPLNHKRRHKKVIKNLERMIDLDIEGFIINEIDKQQRPVNKWELSGLIGLPPNQLNSEVDNIKSHELLSLGENEYFLDRSSYDKIYDKLLKKIVSWHKNNTLDEFGLSFEHIKGVIKKEFNKVENQFVEKFLDDLTEQGKLKKIGSTWASPGHKVELTEKDKKDIKEFEKYFIDCSKHAPLQNEIKEEAVRLKVSEKKLEQILRLLKSRKKLYFVDGSYISAQVVDESREKLLKYLEKNDKITVAEFRDLIDANRKICLLLFSLFDKENMTFREGDYRKLTSILRV